MERLSKVLLSAGLFLCFVGTGLGYRCERENIWGSTQIFHCPESGDNPDERFCCGSGDDKYCCSRNTDEEIEQFFEKEAIEQEDGAHFSPLVEMVKADKDSSIFTNLRDRFNHTMKNIKKGFEGTVDRLKERVKQKLKEKVVKKFPVPSAPVALAQVKPDPMVPGTTKTTIGGKVRAAKDKLKAKINSTVSIAKTKVKQKVKDKVKEKASKKLDPTGGHLPTIAGVIGAIILTLIVLCIVCCCCCPFCLLYKRRNQGTIHNPNPEVSVMQPLQAQPQAYAPQQHAPYPTQPMHPPQPGYAPQPVYPSQAGYPPQPYPPAPYPTDQPPMYTEKQPPPYNPTY